MNRNATKTPCKVLSCDVLRHMSNTYNIDKITRGIIPQVIVRHGRLLRTRFWLLIYVDIDVWGEWLQARITRDECYRDRDRNLTQSRL